MNIQMPDRSMDAQMDRRLTDGGYKKDGQKDIGASSESNDTTETSGVKLYQVALTGVPSSSH